MTGEAKGKGPGADPDAGGAGRGSMTPQEQAAMQRRLDDIGGRLDHAKARHAPPPEEVRARGAAMGQAMRIAVELVVGVAVGGAVGWYLDRWLGTSPWLLLLFVLMGFAAGILNVIRTAQRMQARAEPLQKAAKSVRDDDEDR